MRYLIYWLAFTIFCATGWVYINFGSALIEQIIFQIAYIGPPKDTYPIVLFHLFIRDCLVVPIVWTVIIAVFEILYTKVVSNFVSVHNNFLRVFFKNFHFILLIFSFLYLEYVFAFRNYFISQVERNAYYANYVNPKDTKISLEEKKNLVLIYAESVETIFNNASYYNKNLLKDLESLKGIRFANFRQVPGTGWTIAGIYASQCAEYLKLDFLVNETVCLSDILSENGYRNVYLQGASLDFTHTGIFLKKHKYHEIYGREEWKLKGYSKFNEWGLYDDELFEEAKLKFHELYASNQPFLLTILTVDTHCPHGYVSNYCRKINLDKTYEDLVECSAKQISNFVKYIQEQDYLQNTNIVVMGDHLNPRPKHIPEEVPLSERLMFNVFISNGNYQKQREEIVHFDLLATILKFMGFSVPGEKLGIGKSAF